MQRSVKFSAKLNNLIAGISDRITQHTTTCSRQREGGRKRGSKRERGKEAVKCDPQGGK